MAEVRIANVPLPGKKHIMIGIQKIYGIGNTRAKLICENTGVEPSKLIDDLTEAEIKQLADEVKKFVTEGDLRRQVALDKKRLKDIGCYRGKRHRNRLPARGQRSRTNARTAKGRKRAVADKGK